MEYLAPLLRNEQYTIIEKEYFTFICFNKSFIIFF